jgi:uncharacterized membrane protein YoaK (UPF0700 family)
MVNFITYIVLNIFGAIIVANILKQRSNQKPFILKWFVVILLFGCFMLFGTTLYYLFEELALNINKHFNNENQPN